MLLWNRKKFLLGKRLLEDGVCAVRHSHTFLVRHITVSNLTLFVF